MMRKYYFTFLFLLNVGYIVFGQSTGWIDISEEGTIGKNEKWTSIIQKSIDKAAENGGGTLYFPAGDYLTGAIEMKSNITLYIEAGAVLRFSDDFDDYLPFREVRWEGTVMKTFSPLIYANNAENITIKGRGKIDGQGKAWWNEMYRVDKLKGKSSTKYQKIWDKENPNIEVEEYYKENLALRFFRPPLFQAFQCSNILIEGVTFQNSPFWTINPAFCDNLNITGVTITNPPSPNTDGINPTSCKNVHISNCHISVGDDCITIKSGRDIDGRKWGVPTENVTITNCTMLSGHGGVVIGSEMSGGIKKITISNCVFDGTDRGIRLKTARGRGGIVEDIRVDNIVMRNIKQEAIKLNMFYDHNRTVEPVSERTPTFRNIHISDLTGTNVNKAGSLEGISEMPIENISFSNVNIQAKEGMDINTAKNIELHDVTINTEMGSSLKVQNSEYIVLDNVKSIKPLEDAPILEFENVKDVLVQNTFMPDPIKNFISIKGEGTANVVVKNNTIQHAEKSIEIDDAVGEKAVRVE